MKAGRKALALTAVITILIVAVLSIAGCLEAIAPTNDNGGENGAPDLQAQLQEQIAYVRSNAATLAASIHNLINEERRKAGLDRLGWDQALANIALSHSMDMGERDYFDHISPEGKDFADRYTEHGYHLDTRIGDHIYVGGENLALTNVVRSYTYDQDTGEVLEYKFNDLDELARSTVQGWMESPGHRENILTPFSREGLGAYVTDEGEIYITEDFS